MTSETTYFLCLYPRFQPRPAGAVDGVFLVDSIAFFRGENDRTTNMAEAMQYILWTTGLYCMAIVAPTAQYNTFRSAVKNMPDIYGMNFFVVISGVRKWLVW